MCGCTGISQGGRGDYKINPFQSLKGEIQFKSASEFFRFAYQLPTNTNRPVARISQGGGGGLIGGNVDLTPKGGLI